MVNAVGQLFEALRYRPKVVGSIAYRVNESFH